jgi:hypothetical protein
LCCSTFMDFHSNFSVRELLSIMFYYVKEWAWVQCCAEGTCRMPSQTIGKSCSRGYKTGKPFKYILKSLA